MLNKKLYFSSNQSLAAPRDSRRSLFIISHLTLFFALFLWFSPLTHPFCKAVDHWVFQTLNGSLLNHPDWQTFIGLLNHRYEARFNLFLAALFNLWAIFATQDKRLRDRRIKQTLYFWAFFEIGFTLQDYVINHLMHIERDSPSLVLSPLVKLSETLQDLNIKDSSKNSFLGGHAFAMIYWASFTFFCAPKSIARIGMMVAVLLCLPRLFSGAHWFSDVLFAGLLAIAWLSWTLILPFYRWIILPTGLLGRSSLGKKGKIFK